MRSRGRDRAAAWQEGVPPCSATAVRTAVRPCVHMPHTTPRLPTGIAASASQQRWLHCAPATAAAAPATAAAIATTAASVPATAAAVAAATSPGVAATAAIATVTTSVGACNDI